MSDSKIKIKKAKLKIADQNSKLLISLIEIIQHII
jgi:hypothetical protein